MIISGVVITATGVINDHIVAPSAIDCSIRPPLFLEHRRPIGHVLHLQAIGETLFAMAETDDPEALTLGFFSPAGKALDRTRRADGRWDVSRFTLQEISVVRTPKNPAARITERAASDPFIALSRLHATRSDLMIQHLGACRRYLEVLQRTTSHEAA